MGFILFYKMPVTTIKHHVWRFLLFCDISLFEKLIEKSSDPHSLTFVRGAIPVIAYKLWNKSVIGLRRWNISTQKRTVCYIEIDVILYVIKGSMKLIH